MKDTHVMYVLLEISRHFSNQLYKLDFGCLVHCSTVMGNTQICNLFQS